MDLFEAIANRHSYRGEFTAAPAPRGDLEKIVRAGIQAPSGCNEQVATFVIVDDPHLLRQIAEIVDKPVCRSARAMIVCLTDPRPAYAGTSFAAEDCAAAVENMLLAITALGYASVWLDGAVRVEDRAARIGRLLGVPPERTVRVLLPIGVPAEPGRQKEKLPFHRRAWFNRHGLAARVLMLAWVFLGAAAVCALGMAQQQTGVTAKLHPWGRFEPGTWKLVRVVTETIDEQGKVVSTSTTETKTTLVDIDDDGVTLEIQTCMEVAGKRFQAEPQTVRQGFHGESPDLNLKLKEPVDGQVVIEDRPIVCKVQELELVDANGKTDIQLHYSATTPPYVLKRKSVTRDPEGKDMLSETSVEAIALDMPIRVRGEIRGGSYVKTVHRNAKGTMTTLAVVVPEVPGGVVGHSSKEVDSSGRLVRRSTLELLDYNADPDKDRAGVFNRKRSGRRAKSASRQGS